MVIIVGRIEHIQATSVQIKLDCPRAMQLDGDIIGKTRGMHVFIRKNAIHVRRPYFYVLAFGLREAGRYDIM